MSKSHWVNLREKRNRLLNGSDLTQLPDCSLTDAKKAEWATYRQALRDIPQRWPSDVDETSVSPYTGPDALPKWPTKPS